MKRDKLERATKHAHDRARQLGTPITWKQARALGERWCVKMWPDFFEAVSK